MEIELPLKALVPADVITLQGVGDDSSEYDLSIPVAKRWKVTAATLTFPYHHSSALLPRVSQLVVDVNGIPVSQIALEPSAAKGQASVAIPPELLETGYNPFRFFVAQHVVDSDCEDPTRPELWTRVDLTRATFSVAADRVPVPERVSAIADFLFDPRDFLSQRVHFVVPEVSAPALRRAVEAAAGVALRYDYRPIRFSVSSRLRPQMDNVVIGPPPFIKGFLGDRAPAVDAALIGVRRLPLDVPENGVAETDVDSSHALVVISGNGDEALDRATRAFSLQSFPFPDTADAPIEAVEEPVLSERRYDNSIEPEKTYTLAGLGLDTFTFEGALPKPRGVTLRMPSDMFRPPNLPIKLVLNLAYGSGLREDSSLNVMVNEKFVAAVPLDSTRGGVYRGYEVHLLMSAFKAGINRIRFVPVLTPPIRDKCTPVQKGNLVVTLFGDSYLSMPEARYWIEMPSLRAFIIDGFPFGRWPDMRGTELVLADNSSEAASAALNLVALAAQRIGYPPTRMALSIGKPAHPERDTLMVGSWPLPAVGETGQAPAVFRMLNEGRIPMPQLERAEGVGAPFSGLERFLAQWVDFLPENLPTGRDRLLAVETIGSPLAAGRGILAQFGTPGSADRTTLVLTAGAGPDVADTAEALWEPDVQGAIDGDLSLVRMEEDGPEVVSTRVADPYFLGKVGRVPVLEHVANTHPWMVFGVALSGMALLALILFMLLRRRRNRRMKDDAEA